MGQDPENHSKLRTQAQVGQELRRRIQSTSAAEEIVSGALKARQSQPDRPVHRARDSFLSWSSDFRKYDGVFNWGTCMLFLGSLKVCVANISEHGFAGSIFQWCAILDILHENHIHFSVMFLLLAGLVLPCIALLLEKRMAAKPSSYWNQCWPLYIVSFTLHLLTPVVIINMEFFHLTVIPALVACLLYTTVSLKMISYIQVNKWCRDLAVKSENNNNHRPSGGGDLLRDRKFSYESSQNSRSNPKDDYSYEENKVKLVQWPENLTLKDMTYFVLAPTLCYELNFPRNVRVRKSFLISRIMEVVLGVNLMHSLICQWIVPNVIDSDPNIKFDLSYTLERVIRIAVPNHVLWLFGFYLYFHSFLNALGELLQFADRNFYHDWWNAKNLEIFWRNWNFPVHKWCVRHLYKPTLQMGYSKLLAYVIVFSISAFFHEYLVSVPLKTYKPWAFLGMLGQVPLIFFSKLIESKYGCQLGNLTVWASLIIGQPLAIVVYVQNM